MLGMKRIYAQSANYSTGGYSRLQAISRSDAWRWVFAGTALFWGCTALLIMHLWPNETHGATIGLQCAVTGNALHREIWDAGGQFVASLDGNTVDKTITVVRGKQHRRFIDSEHAVDYLASQYGWQCK